MDDDSREPLRTFAFASVWSIVSALPSLVLHALEIPGMEGDTADAGPLILSGLWFLCGGLTSPALGRILGAVPVVKALPAAELRLDHLPAGCAVLVREAALIRGQLDAMRFDEALQRAWELAGEVERAGPEVRAALEQSGASLQAVREIAAARAGSAIPGAVLRGRLHAALAEFERALTSPRTGLFR
ncbi:MULTISPECIES: hypothetical protein [Nannocystis]|uniref:Uncharacterized protein n=1 Tax=Nannocystis radixulma TaxID=2995305 RepID=A0ABT5AY92_9BACT|nr:MULTISPECIES: hypothetical protein [Nannocystis]MCY1054284.1 hypothetical protein [Nannocystis sp. SCPEA4]MDC0666814.1 hypothetical protein [Nannocystis radixulma]